MQVRIIISDDVFINSIQIYCHVYGNSYYNGIFLGQIWAFEVVFEIGECFGQRLGQRSVMLLS